MSETRKQRELTNCSTCGNLVIDKDYRSRDDVAGVPTCRCDFRKAWEEKRAKMGLK
jgi:hypothetical protein